MTELMHSDDGFGSEISFDSARLMNGSSLTSPLAVTHNSSLSTKSEPLKELGPIFDCEGPVTSEYGFLHAMSIFASKPQVLNKRVKAAEVILDVPDLFPRFYRSVEDTLVLISENQLPYDMFESLGEPFNECTVNQFKDYDVDRIVLRRRVIGKSCNEYTAKEVWDLKNRRVVIVYEEEAYSEPLPEFPPLMFDAYMVGNDIFRIMIGVSSVTQQINNCSSLISSLRHYHMHFMPKVLKWGASSSLLQTSSFIPSTTLKLVSAKAYYEEYKILKDTYFHPLKDIWNESTDPLKFIPEELGIAAYIKIFIDGASNGEQWNFVDLGCGNGMLTFLLAQYPGVNGYGFDIRSRKLWEGYESLQLTDTQSTQPVLVKPDLRVLSFNPFSDRIDTKPFLWMLGNHCDELTPWIPVISRNTNAIGFVVIPCCFYDFGGKYQNGQQIPEDGLKLKSCTRYSNYLEYISSIGQKCGYVMYVDKLRIPSTKRVCLIGINQSSFQTHEETELLLMHAKAYATSKITQYPSTTDNIVFKPRDAVEKVNNCSQLDKSMVKSIVLRVFKKLSLNFKRVTHEEFVSIWDAGSPHKLSDLANLLTPEERDMIKAQGKGLQTILKNHKQIFRIQGGFARLRIPIIDELPKEDAKLKLKTKMCFYHEYHHYGCPLPPQKCRFKHFEDDEFYQPATRLSI